MWKKDSLQSVTEQGELWGRFSKGKKKHQTGGVSGADYSKQIDPVYEKGLSPVFVVVYMKDDTGKDKDLVKTHNCLAGV